MLDIPGGETNEQKALQLKRSRYGLGDRRSLDQLIEFSGVDLRHKKATIDGKNRCGNLQWVPFTEHPKGANFIPSFNETTEAPLDLPYDKSSVWYDPLIDGAGAGMISRDVIQNEEDPKENEIQNAEEEEAAHAAFKEEAKQLAGNSHHVDEHMRLAAALEEQSGNSEHKEVISSAAAAAVHAEKMEKEGVVVFPPLLRGPTTSALTKGKLFLSQRKHGIEHLPIQVKISIILIIFGLCAAIITSGAGRGKRKKESKKR